MSAPERELVVSTPSGRVALEGTIESAEGNPSVVVFSHDSGSGRHTPHD